MIHVEIVTPNGLYKELEVSILNVATIDGERGILSEHVPFVTMLKVGKMVCVSNDERLEFAINKGLLYFENNKARILTDSIESKEEIDENRANKAKDRALEYLRSKDSSIDLKRAEYALSRAINRIKVKSGS